MFTRCRGYLDPQQNKGTISTVNFYFAICVALAVVQGHQVKSKLAYLLGNMYIEIW
jgi:hypothetical protein